MHWELDFEDVFEGDSLDRSRWLPYYLPHWSSRELAAARYEVDGGCLRLLIEEDQQPWCPELDGDLRVSSVQTALVNGQHRFNPAAVVRETQAEVRLYTPHYGRIEVGARASDDPRVMGALWLIGLEDEPERSGEICVCELFGRDLGGVGMGVHPFSDSALVDEFEYVRVTVDAREFHEYAIEWTREQVAWFVDGERVKVAAQSPAYPMQLMLSLYEFPGPATGVYPKEFVVDYVRGYRPSA